jgi:hypothetical protein
MLCAGYFHQFWSTNFTSTTKLSHYTRSFLFANAVLCFLAMIVIVVFCVLGSIGILSGRLIVSTWVSLND